MVLAYLLIGAVVGAFIVAMFSAGGMNEQLKDAYDEGYEKGRAEERDRIWNELETKYGKK